MFQYVSYLVMVILHWLVVYLPLWKIWKSVGISIPNIWKTSSTPPTTSYFVLMDKTWVYSFIYKLYWTSYTSFMFIVLLMVLIWANYNISLTWILRPFGDDFPKINHDSRARSNSEVVMKFTQIHIFTQQLGMSENSVPRNPMVNDHYPDEKWLFHWEYTQHFHPTTSPSVHHPPAPALVHRYAAAGCGDGPQRWPRSGGHRGAGAPVERSHRGPWGCSWGGKNRWNNGYPLVN